MKTVSLHINESEYEAFMNMLKQFKSVTVMEATEDVKIPTWHTEIIEGRMANTVEEDFIPWDTAKSSLKKK